MDAFVGRASPLHGTITLVRPSIPSAFRVGALAIVVSGTTSSGASGGAPRPLDASDSMASISTASTSTEPMTSEPVDPPLGAPVAIVDSSVEESVDESDAEPEAAPAAVPAAFNAEADLDRAGILAEGAESSGEIALTFDDGPAPDTTPEVLRVLAQHHVKGAFFFTGRRLEGDSGSAEANRDVARAVVAEGHTIGNHGLDHFAVNKKSAWWNATQIEDSAHLILAATGVAPHWFRPPFGKIGASGRAILRERGDELVMWTIDAQDTKARDPEKLAARLIAQILYAGQGIVLLHDLRAPSVKGLALLLDWLDAHPRDASKGKNGTGYTVVDLPTYLAHAAQRPWPYQTRMQLYHVRERLHRMEVKPHAARKHPGDHLRKPLHKS